MNRSDIPRLQTRFLGQNTVKKAFRTNLNQKNERKYDKKSQNVLTITKKVLYLHPFLGISALLGTCGTPKDKQIFVNMTKRNAYGVWKEQLLKKSRNKGRWAVAALLQTMRLIAYNNKV